MKRKITEQLYLWTQQEKGRLPLLIYGARQVGKTYVMKELGAELFQNAVYINFEMDRKIGAYFEQSIDPNQLILLLEQYCSTTITAGRTLLIFDEIQMCERALTSLKYFAEEAPEFHVIAAGSLLGVALHREQYSFPVGNIQMLNLFPMDFEEYLWARGKELLSEQIRDSFTCDRPMPRELHQEAMQEYQKYCMIGGMPAAVLAETTGSSSLGQEEIRQMILNSYIADMAKYADPAETVKIFAAYDSLPAQLAKDTKKFQYKLIKSGARASQYGTAIDWLIQSGIVNKCGKCKQGFMPPAAYQDLSAFKLYYSDLGILSARLGMSLRSFLNTESEHFRGIFAENYTACALKANGYELMYWESDGTAEVDFLIVKEDRVIPIECKAGDHVKAKSLMVYQQKYSPEYCIRISGRNFGMEKGIKSVPLYGVYCI